MERFKYFCGGYFNQTFYFDVLDEKIERFKTREHPQTQQELIDDLENIIKEKRYKKASQIFRDYGDKILDKELTELVVTYIYNKLLGKPAKLDMSLFFRDCKVVFCPVCTPDIEKAKKFSLIDKATIIKNNQQIFICKKCKLVWLNENEIHKDNAQSYTKFMQSLGLDGTWKELKDVDIL